MIRNNTEYETPNILFLKGQGDWQAKCEESDVSLIPYAGEGGKDMIDIYISGFSDGTEGSADGTDEENQIEYVDYRILNAGAIIGVEVPGDADTSTVSDAEYTTVSDAESVDTDTETEVSSTEEYSEQEYATDTTQAQADEILKTDATKC